jgi:hypothetical protein
VAPGPGARDGDRVARARRTGAGRAGGRPAAGQQLLLFDTATPTSTTTRAITGLGANETLRGIDQRPFTLGLYGVTVTTGAAANSVLTTYAIDPGTGQATPVGTTAAALAGAGDVPTRFDFNPLVDRMRYVNTNDENARLNPNNGALAGNDTDLTPAATSTVIAEAYDRNSKDSEATTLYAIDRNDSQLALQGGINGTPSPNGGVVTDIGALGFTLSAANDGGFDIARGGTAYAALTNAADNITRLYTINLATGAATAVGVIGTGMQEVRGLAILDAKPAGVPAPTLSPAPPPAPPPPPPPDTLRPTGLLAFDPGARIRAFRRSGLRGRFSCSEACTVSARVVLRRTRLATGRATLPEAGVGTLRLRATRAARRALRGRRRARTTLIATFTDPAGNRSTLRRRVTLSR